MCENTSNDAISSDWPGWIRTTIAGSKGRKNELPGHGDHEHSVGQNAQVASRGSSPAHDSRVSSCTRRYTSPMPLASWVRWVLPLLVVLLGACSDTPVDPPPAALHSPLQRAPQFTGQPEELEVCLAWMGWRSTTTGVFRIDGVYRRVRVGQCLTVFSFSDVDIQSDVRPGDQVFRVLAILEDGATEDLEASAHQVVSPGAKRRVTFIHRTPSTPPPPATPLASLYVQEASQRVTADPDGWCRTTLTLTAIHGAVLVRSVRSLGATSDVITPIGVTLDRGASMVVAVEALADPLLARNVAFIAAWSPADSLHRSGQSSRGMVCEAS